jgi:hypothetical protein
MPLGMAQTVIRVGGALACWLAVQRGLKQLPLDKWLGLTGVDSNRMDLKICCILHSLIVGPLSIYSLLADPADQANLQQMLLFGTVDIRTTSAYAQIIIPCSVSFFILELMPGNFERWYTKSEFLMIPHHIMSILSWSRGLSFGCQNYFAVFCTMTEMSSPFM